MDFQRQRSHLDRKLHRNVFDPEQLYWHDDLQHRGSVAANLSLVFDDDPHGFQRIQTDTGRAQLGFALAQGTVTCGVTGKKQTFATNISGILFPSAYIDAIVGRVILDGKGNITGTEIFSVDGVISEASVTGTYTQNANCTGTMQITPAGSPTTNFNSVVVNGG